MDRNFRKDTGDGSDGRAPSEAWLFAQAILDKPIPRIVRPEVKARAERQELERLAQFSSRHAEELGRLQYAEAKARHDRELLEWAARISTECADELRALQRQEAEEREAWRRAERFVEMLREGTYDPAKHPRAPKGQPEGGQWIDKGGGGGTGGVVATGQSAPFRTAAFHPSQTTTKLAAFSGAAPSTWPTYGPLSSWLPKLGTGTWAGMGSAVGVVAGGLLGGLRNATMGAYWDRVPGVKAMPKIWAYELEKRVRAGKLWHDDAVGIFNTAVLGAEAQGFKPTGGTMSEVHKSAVDFLGKAEAVYFARKKQAADAAGKADAGGAQAKPERVTGDALDKARREFEGMKPQLWKEEAEKNSQKYTPEQLARMRTGKAPRGSDGEPMEIHHKKPLSEGGTNTRDNFEFTTQTAHRLGPNLKKNHPNLPRGRRP